MPSALSYPGVYVEEIPSGVRTITGVATSVTAFIGRARKGPVDQAVDITSFADFERIFGGLWNDSTMSFAVRDFFLNGGSRAVIVRLFHSLTAEGINAIADAAAKGANGKDAKDQAAAALAKIPDTAASEKDAAKQAKAEIDKLGDADDANKIVAAVASARALIKSDARSIQVGTLTFAAASPGQWAGNLRLMIQAASGPGVADTANRLGVQTKDLFNLAVTDLSPGGTGENHLNVTVADSVRRVDKVLTDASTLIAWGGGDLDKNKPNLPDFAAVHGDNAIGEKYYVLQQAIKNNPDPLSDPVKKAKDAYSKALQDALASVDDGGDLVAADFLKPNGSVDKAGLYALEQLYTRDGIFNLLCIAPYNATDDVDTNVIAAAGAYCEYRRAMLIVDSPSTWTTVAKATDGFSADPDQVGYRGKNGAIFFPRLKIANPLTDDLIEVYAACGTVAGIFARTDTQRGVWKSPAGLDTSLLGVSSLSVAMTDDENGLLNPLGINCLRTFPVFGRVVWGSRTLRGADAFADEYKYIAVRRTALFIEESLYRALKWVVFEPNDEPLWGQIRLNVGAFMHNLFRQGAFEGSAARDAYFVRCDASTTTQNDINLGIVNILVGFAPLKPAEFVVIKLQQIAGQIET
jgi:phage tail sheath protein FI